MTSTSLLPASASLTENMASVSVVTPRRMGKDNPIQNGSGFSEEHARMRRKRALVAQAHLRMAPVAALVAMAVYLAR